MLGAGGGVLGGLLGGGVGGGGLGGVTISVGGSKRLAIAACWSSVSMEREPPFAGAGPLPADAGACGLAAPARGKDAFVF